MKAWRSGSARDCYSRDSRFDQRPKNVSNARNSSRQAMANLRMPYLPRELF